VVIDAGHGGPDPGMRGTLPDGRTIHEKDITLGVARRVADRLRADGIDVVMTRDRDTLIALSDRGRIATRQRGDLFISIHVNAANPRWTNARGARGFETYFLSDARTDDDRRVAEIENEVVKYETDAAPSGPNDPLGFILGDMLQNEYLRESSELAATVQTALARVHPGTNRGVKQAGFRVLVTSFMPSVLVELGFGTNPSEAAYLASARGQGALAEAIAGAALEYLAVYDQRRASAGGTR
jgi:N-acetylmuramoyl-L-alanine amidase